MTKQEVIDYLNATSDSYLSSFFIVHVCEEDVEHYMEDDYEEFMKLPKETRQELLDKVTDDCHQDYEEFDFCDDFRRNMTHALENLK